MVSADLMHRFLHDAHVFASTVQEIMGEKYLRETAEGEVSLPQFELLRLIERNGNHQVRQIASFMGVSQAAASKNVDKLVRLGLVARVVQESDRRAVSLSLTSRGRNIIRRYEALKAEKLTRVLGGFSDAEVEAISLGLQKVAHRILAEEGDSHTICMKCSAYYVDHCPLRGVTEGCIYHKCREHASRG
ncbi:MAG: MarR family transcriptional regulator [Gemmatimonadota bacterium]